MKKFITRKPKRPVEEYVEKGLCFQANIGADSEGTNVYFVAYVMPVDVDEVFYGCAWGPKLFNGLTGSIENDPKTEFFYGSYWPQAVQYVKNRQEPYNQVPRLIFWDQHPKWGVDEDVWMLGYFVKDVDFKEIIELTDFNFAHILKVLELNMRLLIELMDDYTMQRFIAENRLDKLPVPPAYRRIFGSPKIFETFGITLKDIGKPKEGFFMPLWKGGANIISES